MGFEEGWPAALRWTNETHRGRQSGGGPSRRRPNETDSSSRGRESGLARGFHVGCKEQEAHAAKREADNRAGSAQDGPTGTIGRARRLAPVRQERKGGTRRGRMNTWQASPIDGAPVPVWRER